MSFEIPERLKSLPPYLFVEIDRKKQEALARGVDVVDLGVGDPDLPTPALILDRLRAATNDPANHVYPFGKGHPQFRQTVADWFAQRFGTAIDPAQEVMCLIGSKEGIGHAPLAFVNPGAGVLVPEPGYPAYQAGAVFAGAAVDYMPLLRENRFLPDLDKIPVAAASRAKLMFLNYPNNPTAACIDLEFLEKAVAWCRRHDVVLAYDMAYSELYYEGGAPPSIMQIPGARDIAIEFHSFSKTFSMAGWRIGFAVGAKKLIDALTKLKGNLDSGTVSAIQLAAAAGLQNYREIVPPLVAVYRRRRDIFVNGLQQAGFDVKPPAASLYVWCPVPAGMKSMEFAARLLEERGVVATPGIGFGPSGEGFIRFSLTSPEARLQEAVRRIQSIR